MPTFIPPSLIQINGRLQETWNLLQLYFCHHSLYFPFVSCSHVVMLHTFSKILCLLCSNDSVQHSRALSLETQNFKAIYMQHKLMYVLSLYTEQCSHRQKAMGCDGVGTSWSFGELCCTLVAVTGNIWAEETSTSGIKMRMNLNTIISKLTVT